MLVAFLGAPRSGTQWISDMMRACGLDVGHERMGQHGTSCGFAVWAEYLDDLDGSPVIYQDVKGVEFDLEVHLFRDPIATMRTLPHVLAWDNRSPWFVRHGFYPEDTPWDPKLASLLYLTKTRKKLIELDLPVFRVDRYEKDWLDLAHALALPEIPPTVPRRNSRAPYWEPTWDDLLALDPETTADLRSIADALGY